MQKTLTTMTVREIVKGFEYNELEGKGLYGLDGTLVIQPEYQRNYIYAEKNKDVPVITTLLGEGPIGLLYFNKPNEDILEVLDGQQRITSIGRFVNGQFAIKDANGMQQYFDSLSNTQQNLILDAEVPIYVVEGTEEEIKKLFQTINLSNEPLREQELLNAVYSGEFVTLAKQEFSNTQNSNNMKRGAYVSGSVNRQDYLATALNWVSGGDIDGYMSRHRHDDNIEELTQHFNKVIAWSSGTFSNIENEMKTLDWGKLYRAYGEIEYDLESLNQKVKKLYGDEHVKNRKGIWEYVLGGETDSKLLGIRFFEDSVKKAAYAKQTESAKKAGKSNCSYCAIGHDANATKIHSLNDMDADHVKAWSKGGETTAANCEMLCKNHNRAKGNS